MEPKVFTSETRSVELVLYNPPECFQVEVFDVTGRRTEVGRVCPEEELPATYRDAKGNVTSPPAPSGEPTASGVYISDPPNDTGESSGEETSGEETSGAAPTPNEDHLGRRAVAGDGGGGCSLGLSASRSPLTGWWAAGLLIVLFTRLGFPRSRRFGRRGASEDHPRLA